MVERSSAKGADGAASAVAGVTRDGSAAVEHAVAGAE